jgi:hypothetical protein
MRTFEFGRIQNYLFVAQHDTSAVQVWEQISKHGVHVSLLL